MPARYERLSAVDAAFLDIETPEVHMHVGGLVTLDAAPLTTPDGGVDFEAIRDRLEQSMAGLPRMRQRVRRVEGLRHWVWVDDPYWAPEYHIRHTALPRPGDEEQLERLASRIYSQPLDRERPLWEIWVVEGLQGGRFALLAKIHHCLLDGVGAVNLLLALSAGWGAAAAPRAEAPVPTGGDLVLGELRHRFEGWKQLGRAARDLLQRRDAPPPASDAPGWRDLARGLGETLRNGLQQADPLPINPDSVSPHRRYRCLDVPLADLRIVRQAFGGTLNDVVLTVVAGALRRYLSRHGLDVDQLRRVRALVPANMRPRGTDAAAGPDLGNRVALLLVGLPVHIRNPVERLESLREHTAWLRNESYEAAGTEWMENVDDRLGLGIVSTTLKVAMFLRSFNIVVTNIPGPPTTIELLGAPVHSIAALVPNFHHQGVGIAVFSYNGRLRWGLGADWDAMPDVDAFVADLRDELAALAAHAATTLQERGAANGPA